MARMTLHIIGDNSDAKSKIEALKANLSELGKNPIKINIDSSGLEAVDKTAVKVLQAQARIAEANARVTASENNLKIAREKSSQEADKRASAEAKLATQMEKTATAEEQARKANTNLQTQIEKTSTEEAKLAVQAEKTSTEQAKLATQQEKTATASVNLQTQQEKTATATAKAGTAAERTAVQTETLWDKISKFGQWYLIGGAFSKLIGTFREALSTMKEVDSELVTVRKVTGFTADEMARVEEQAYKTASAYGVAANEYLESVAAFARAGYREQSESLAELSTKTQIVGDTTADVANQFLLSVDAAYKYEGSIESLSRVLDGANELDNNYATSIEKIAEGMGIVAPVAAQMHVTIDELAASIGTITAVTQRSGSEAARALRALFLNIAGDTKTEIDEGVTWTTGEIEGLRDVIRLYAKDAWDAAQATGGIIDPMKAMEGLAKSMQDGILSEQQLIEMVSDIGGKLRTSQLLAIIQNWDMYSDMLDSFSDSVGSADKEVENALDSWERKTNILKNTWTEFISHLVETEQIKGILDTLTSFIEGLDSPLGKATAAVLAFAGAWKVLHSSLIAAHPVIAAISLALGAAITIYGKHKQAAEEAAKEYSEMTASAKKLQSELDGLDDSTKQSAREINGTVDAAEQLISKMEELEGSVSTSADAQQQYAAAVQTLNGLIPSLGLEINEQTGLVDQSTDSIRANTEAWKENAIVQANAEALQGVYQAYAEAQTELSIRTQERADKERELTSLQVQRIGVEARLRKAQEGRDTANLYLLDSERASAAMTATEDYNALVEEYTDQLDTLDRQIEDTQDELGLLDDAIAEDEEALAAAEEQVGLTERALGIYNDTLEKTGDAEKAHKEAVGAMVEDLLTLEDELESAKAAIEAFGKATESEKGDTFTAYAGIYEQFLEAWENGLKGSNTVKAAIEAILGPEVIAQYAGDWEVLGELLASDFWRGVFAEGGEDHGVAFMNSLSEIANEYGNVVDAHGKVVASFKEVDGALTLTGYDLDGLAEMLGTTPDLMTALIDAWDIWSGGILTSRDELLGLADALGALNGTNTVDVTEFLQGLVDSAENYSSTEIWDLYNALTEIGGVNLTNVPEDIAGIISKADEAKGATEDASGALEDLDSESAEPKVELDTKRFDSGIRYVESTLDKLSKTPTIITVTTKEIDGLASGTDFAEGGPTLVNEEGPEIIQEGGKARIAGGGKPTITNVERGARIFTAEETEQILSGYSSLRFFHAAAMGRASNMTDGGSGNRSANLMPTYAPGPKTSTYYSSNYTSAASAAVTTAQAASAAADATSAIEDAQKEIEDRYKTELDLLKSQLELMEKQGASAEERAAKISEIQNTLHLEAEELRGIGASETDINKLSAEWWDYLEDRQKAFIDEYEDAIELKKSELSLMEAQGVSEDERAAKIGEIQSLLHEEAEYMRSIGYSQAEINGLSEEWLDLQKEKIELLTIETEKRANIVTLREAELSFLEASDASVWSQLSKMREIQDALHDEAEAVRSTAAYQEAIRQQQEDETKLTDEQVALLNRVTGLSTEWWKYQSQITDLLEESDDTLERITERYEELSEHYTSLLDEAEESRVAALQEELDLLKEQKDEIDDAREEEEKLLAVEKARIALENAQKERNVRQYNAATGQWEWVANAQTVAKAREDLAKAEQELDDFYRDRSIKALEENIKTIQTSYDDLRDAIKEFVKGIKDGTLSFTDAISFFTSRFAGTSLAGLAGAVGSSFLNAGRDTVLDKMKANSAAWFSADEKTRQDLANQNYALGTAQGWHRGNDGVWYDASGRRVYDSGGILRGVGGVKATRGDEMILPPGITSQLLTAERNGAFDAFLGHLGIVTAAANGYAGFSGSITQSRIGTQMNGDSYSFGNITLSENQARGMTVYDLAQMARGLSLHSVS